MVWNRNYEPWQIERDSTIKSTLEADGFNVSTFNASLLWEPWKILNQSGLPYKVFTPFYRKGCLNAEPPSTPIERPKNISVSKLKNRKFDVNSLNLMPKIKWFKTMEKTWTPGEEGAKQKLDQFLNGPVDKYKTERDFPGIKGTSRLSPHLHFGEISPNQVWHAALNNQNVHKVGKDLFHFLSELGWREFNVTTYSIIFRKLLTKISTPHLIIILGQVSNQLLTLGREDEPVYLLSMLE